MDDTKTKNKYEIREGHMIRIRKILDEISEIDGYEYRIEYESLYDDHRLDNCVFYILRRKRWGIFHTPWVKVDWYHYLDAMEVGLSEHLHNLKLVKIGNTPMNDE